MNNSIGNVTGINDEELKKMYEQLFDEKYIRKKLTVFSVFIMVYENFEDTIIENVRTIYFSGIPSRRNHEEQLYRKEVIEVEGCKQNILIGSLKKLMEHQFILEEDYKELKKCAQIRNKVVHEMTECFLGDYYLVVSEALKKLLTIMKKYNKNWIPNFEIPCGLLSDFSDEEIKQINIEDITNVNMQLLELLYKIIASSIED